MIGFSKITLPVFLFFFGITFFNAVQPSEIKHKIKVIHPGISLTDSVKCILVEVQNEKSKPYEFYMDVKSVVCGDAQCRIDIVRVFWDKLGFYNRLELPEGVELEKAKGHHFTEADYEKLNTNLSDPNSPLKNVLKEEVVGTVGSEGVDAMTGATMILEKTAYVKGAVWTCYSLWHWVHGDAINHIRNITGDACSLNELESFLNIENAVFQLFALEQFTRRKNYESEIVELILSVIDKNPPTIKSGIAYFENAPVSVFSNGIHEIMNFSNSENRLLCLNAILKTDHSLSQDFFDQLTFQFSETDSFEEIHLFLKILENKKRVFPRIHEQLLPHLENENFLIARRVYWFLEEQNLSENQRKKMKAFYLKNENRL